MARSGNVSAGTSIFAMIVLEQSLSRVHEEIDIVATRPQREHSTVSTFATADWVPTQWLPEVVMAQLEEWFGLPVAAGFCRTNATAPNPKRRPPMSRRIRPNPRLSFPRHPDPKNNRNPRPTRPR